MIPMIAATDIVASLRGTLMRGLDILLPPRCLGCGEGLAGHGRLCAACWSGLAFITEPCCAACGYPFELSMPGGGLCGACTARRPPWRRGRSALVYDDASRDLVLAFKRGDRTELAVPLAAMMVQAGGALLADCELVLPVPLHRGRLFARRFNQSALLSRAIARAGGLDHAPDLLVRVRATASQGGLDRRRRHSNVRGAFRLRRPVEGRRVLLVDDVLTTGATAAAATRVLLAGGAAAVDVLTLARVATPGQIPI